ncbi:phosphopantetheine-binding protein [Dongia rigui]|uniref:Phosphopantetheine-binding protein n=1 Tax=Dongia rigui TaxID=940149 RepID=A0ABU5E197_9PROT|nr:phosphopantetheine-binding protein [Dongia rigui]MDY0873326.1 phosphopantetheine-binding protein [Dongia rigui]
MDDLERDIKALIIDALKLEDVQPEDIDSEEMLFGSGLGLDSIDALELGIALRRRYGLKIETITDEIKKHFANVRSLAAFVQSEGQGGSEANAVA